MPKILAPLLFSLLIFAGASLRAQHAFQMILPGIDRAAKRPAVQTVDGGFCILGVLYGDDIPYLAMVVVKTTADGNIEWSRRISTSAGNENPVALRRTPDGGFMALAVTSVADSWDQDVLVIKLNDQGYPVWSKSYNVTPVDWAEDLVVLNDGSAVVVGSRMDEEGVEFSDMTYQQRGLIFRIDPEGEVLWSREIRGIRTPADTLDITGCYGQALCAKPDNSVTMIAQLAQGVESWSSLLLNIDDQGKLRHNLWMAGIREQEHSLYAPFANDIAPLPDGGCVVAGIARFYDSSLDYFSMVTQDQGFLLRLDSNNNVRWYRSYQAAGENPLPLSVTTLDAEHYAVAGRTLFSRMFDYSATDLADYDNPVIAVIDQSGNPVEARQWQTSFSDLTAGKRSEETEDSPPHLWWPLFTATEDQGILSVGVVQTIDEPDVYPNGSIGLSLTRFNPDLTTCGNGQTEPTEIQSAPVSTTYSFSHPPYYAAWDPVDNTPYDFRRSMVTSIDTAIPQILPADEVVKGDSGKIEEVSREEDTSYGVGTEEETEEISNNDFETPAAEEEAYAADEYDRYEEGEAYAEDEYATEEYGYEASPDTIPPNTGNNYTLPPLVEAEVLFVDITVQSQPRQDVTVEDFQITPWFLCGENALAATPSAPPADGDIPQAEFLHILPNSVAKGKSVTLEFALHARRKPDIDLIAAGSGEVVLRLEAKNILWSDADGTGSAVIETAGLAAGVYIVRLRCGDNQLSAKLSIQ